MTKKIWVYNPQPAKLDEHKKRYFKEIVLDFIKKSKKLSKSVNRIEVKAGRIYMYQLVEQFGWNDPEAKWFKPLIDGKYAEFPYSRITIFANGMFSVDWQRHTGQWIQLFEDNSLNECLTDIEKETAYFE